MNLVKKLIIDIILILFWGVTLLGQEEMYAPYPSVFIHGIGSSNELWDVARGLPYYETGLGKYYHTPLIDPPYPGWNPVTKPYLEAFSFVPNIGSIDYHNQDDIGYDHKLARQVKLVLDKYYGDGDTLDMSDWMDNPKAKVILIGHSSGGLALRSMVLNFPTLKPHIEKIVTIGTPHDGCAFYTPVIAEIYFYSLLYWLPVPNCYWANRIIPALGDFVFSIWVDKRFTPNGWDLNEVGHFISHINSSSNLPYQYGPKYVSIIGKHGLKDPVIITVWGIATAQAIYLSAHFRFVEAGFKLYSAGFFDGWNKRSDIGVHVNSQNINLRGTGFQAEVLEVNAIHSGWEESELNYLGEARHWKKIANALEDPPVIHLDSLITVDDEVYPISGTKDTIPGFIKGFWGRVDDYLLASNDLRISCNYFTPRRQNIRM